MARCADCDKFLTQVDRDAMAAVNTEYGYWGAPLPYEVHDEDATCDFHCADCIAHEAERAQARRDEDYYGGDSPTLADQAAAAWRFK